MEAVERINPQLPAATASRGSARVRRLSPAELTAAQIQSWIALEAQALQPNAYLSPHFVLPALRHLEHPRGTEILLVERPGPSSLEAIGVLVMHPVTATRQLPLPHHAIYQSRHSYLGAPLLHRDHGVEAARALADALVRHRWHGAGLLLPNVDPDGPLLSVLREAWAGRGLAVSTAFPTRRASIIPAQAGPESFRKRKKFKDLERCRRRLTEQGELQWLIHRQTVDSGVVESFLRLEDDGWKRRHGKSLRSRPADEAFFREMSDAFAREGRAMYTELRLDDRTIASTCNFVSAQEAFAFKLGMDEAFRKYCVGMLNDAELVNQAPEVCGDLTHIDSGAVQDSYMDMLWPHQRSLVTIFLPYSMAGQLAWQGMEALRALRHILRRKPPPSRSVRV